MDIHKILCFIIQMRTIIFAVWGQRLEARVLFCSFTVADFLLGGLPWANRSDAYSDTESQQCVSKTWKQKCFCRCSTSQLPSGREAGPQYRFTFHLTLFLVPEDYEVMQGSYTPLCVWMMQDKATVFSCLEVHIYSVYMKHTTNEKDFRLYTRHFLKCSE